MAVPVRRVVRAVAFDLDDTLVVEEATARASMREAAALLEGHDPDEVADVVLGTARALWRSHPAHARCLALGFASWEGLWATFEGCQASVDELRAWAPTFRRRTWTGALAAVGVHDDALAQAMADAYVEAQRRGHPTVEGAGEVVRSLRGRCRLALLTNGPSDIQRRKLASTGLEDCFDAVVVSGELGIGKPDPRAFLHAADAVGLPPSEVVMVGDSWERDVAGAVGAGMSAVWLSAGRPAPHAAGVAVVEHIRDLGSVLDV